MSCSFNHILMRHTKKPTQNKVSLFKHAPVCVCVCAHVCVCMCACVCSYNLESSSLWHVPTDFLMDFELDNKVSRDAVDQYWDFFFYLELSDKTGPFCQNCQT